MCPGDEQNHASAVLGNGQDISRFIVLRAHPGREAVDDGHDRSLAAGPPLRSAFERWQESGRHRNRAKEVLQGDMQQSALVDTCAVVLSKMPRRPQPDGARATAPLMCRM